MKRYIPIKKLYNSFHLFNEAVIDVNKYLQSLNRLFDDIRNEILKARNLFSIKRILNKTFKEYRIKFKISFKDEIQKHEDYRYGIIVAETLLDKYSTIIIYCNRYILDISKNDKIFEEFKKRCIKYIQHELIHRLQLIDINDLKIKKNLNIKDQDKIKYFSNDKELMAFAWQVVEELRFSGLSDNDIKRKLTKLDFTANHSKTFTIYIRLFKNTENENILKILYKYIYMYLEGNFSDKEMEI
jgi:hypothetical protein